MTVGLVLGKFLPPHAGHERLMAAALAGCDTTVVTLFGRTDEPIPCAVREAWLRELFPTAEIRAMVCDHHEDYEDDATWRFWIDRVRELVPEKIDLVFSSEHYGAELARRLDARHVLVDADRREVPCSGTMVRADPLGSWAMIRGPVRAHYAVRVALVGAESTGKSTLAEALARHYHTTLVAEYGREYCAAKFAGGADSPWMADEFTAIAREQLRREEAAARVCNRVLICDTDAFCTAIWHERYLGRVSEDVERIAASRSADLSILAGAEIAWEQDGTRDGELIRDWMQARFVERLDARGAPWISVRGDVTERLAQAVHAIDAVITARAAGWEIAARWSTGSRDAIAVEDA